VIGVYFHDAPVVGHVKKIAPSPYASERRRLARSGAVRRTVWLARG
jgi:hypothetical protein